MPIDENKRITVYPSFDRERELAEQDGTELQVGAITTDLALIPLAERALWLPTGVLQRNNIMDTSGCASRGPVAILKSKFTYFYTHGMLPELKEWLDRNGYVKDGKIVFDETFIEILSGTTLTGNSMKAPLQAIIDFGLTPELLPLGDTMTWEQYMDRKRITQKIYDLGKEFKKRFGIAYEQVPLRRFAELRAIDWLDNAAYAWPVPTNGVYPNSPGNYNHCFPTFNNEIDAMDSYPEYNPQTGALQGDDFTKRLAKDYAFFEWGYTISVTRQTAVEASEIQLTVWQVLLKNGLLSFFAKWLELFTKKVGAVGTKSFWQKVWDFILSILDPGVPVPPVEDVPPMIDRKKRFLEEAQKWLNKEPTPTDLVLDEVACVSSLVAVLKNVYPFDPSLHYTPTLFKTLKNSRDFRATLSPSPGCIIVSPTEGNRVGHCGIFLTETRIASNDSKNGLWQDNYSFANWIKYFKLKQGLHTYIFSPED